jgi:hypothetical protein
MHISNGCIGKCCKPTTLREELRKTFEEKFDETYGDDISAWTLGIVATALGEGRKKDYGADASHITVKLQKLVEIEREKSFELGFKTGVDTAGSVILCDDESDHRCSFGHCNHCGTCEDRTETLEKLNKLKEK